MLAVSMSPPVVHYPIMQKRPKLSLQTSALPITYGTSSKALSTIATPSAAVTPTTVNTFNNTFDLTHRPSPTSTASPSLVRVASGHNRLSGSQSPRPKQAEPAYTVSLPYGIKSILKNTPFPAVKTNTVSASPRSNTRRVFFPAPKQVEFKSIIEEEIVTKLYTARHSDLFTDASENLEQAKHRDDEKMTVADKDQHTDEVSTTIVYESPKQGLSISISSCKRRKHRRNSIESSTSTETSSNLASTSSSSTLSEPAADPTPPTPASTRKQRKWEWTLAPIASQSSSHLGSADEKTELQTAVKSLLESGCGGASSTCQDLSPSNSKLSKSINAGTGNDIAQPRPDAQLTPNEGQTSHLTLSTSSSSAPVHPTRRAGSLDTCQRKRKAACLDTFLQGMITTDSINSGSIDLSTTSNVDGVTNTAEIQGDTTTGQTGPKRRERAATL